MPKGVMWETLWAQLNKHFPISCKGSGKKLARAGPHGALWRAALSYSGILIQELALKAQI